jgi:large subunit ribosomal protein L1
MKKRSKAYVEAKKQIKKEASLKIAEAIEVSKKVAHVKFDESIELHVNLGIDPKNTDQRIRFTASLPHGTGKSIKILVISEDSSGKKDNIIFRNESVIEEINTGKTAPDKDFNIIIATTAQMKNLAKVARILGPKGLMPSPKNGTVTEDIKKAIDNLSKGQIEIKSQQGYAVLHQVVGKKSFESKKLEDNIQYVLTELNKNTPSKMKKKLIQNAYIASSMGPSIKLEI